MKKHDLFAVTFILFCCAIGIGAEESGGKFSVLSYNVAGLPGIISGSQPTKNTVQISAKLDAFDLVLVQEDFYYHDDLVSKLHHPHISENGKAGTLGDGLARFSKFPFGKVDHVAWETCHGRLWYANDCLTKKGFSFATHTLAPGVEIDVVDLHMDAGNDANDNAARAKQAGQMIAYLKSKSPERALIVAGDFNLDGESKADMKVLDRLTTALGLADSCRTLSCGVERIDRILFRSDTKIVLRPVTYAAEDERFKNEKGAQLSDHIAVSTVFEWSRK